MAIMRDRSMERSFTIAAGDLFRVPVERLNDRSEFRADAIGDLVDLDRDLDQEAREELEDFRFYVVARAMQLERDVHRGDLTAEQAQRILERRQQALAHVASAYQLLHD